MNEIDIRRADLNLLVVFETLMNERHVGRAAARLSLSQSAVSHALGRLRMLFDDPLFTRHPRGIEPTRRSLALYQNVADILDRARAILVSDPPFSPERSHRFTIGQTDGSMPILVTLMERLRTKAPNIELLVRWVDAAGVIPAIDRQEVDLAFAVMPPVRLPVRIEKTPALKTNYVCIAHRDHPAVRRPPRTLDAFASLPHLAISPHGAAISRVDGLLADVGLRRNTVLTIPHFLAAPLIVAKTDLVAIIDESIFRLFANNRMLRTVRMPARLQSISIDLFMGAARTEDPALAWLRDQCLDAAASYARPTASH